jgi:acyl carrier protein
VTRREERIADEIRALAERELGLELVAPAEEELGSRLDSLALLSLVVAVEDRYCVALEDGDAMTTRSLADLARLVARKLDEAPPSAPRRGGAS